MKKSKCIIPILFFTSFFVLSMNSCHSKEVIQGTSADKKIQNEPNKVSNKQAIQNFIEDDLLRGIVLESMYPPEKVIEKLGNKLGEEIVSANIDYEGMKGKTIRKIQYEKFYASIYQMENGNEIFGYIELSKNMKYTKFNIGTSIDDYIDIDGDSINRYGQNTISVYGTYRNTWDLCLTCEIDDKKIIQSVEITIGGI